MAFKKGVAAAKESAERNRFTGGTFHYFKWEPGESKVVRFLTDGCDDGCGNENLLTNLHEYVTCFDGSKRSFVCRREVGEECELCSTPDVRRREIMYAVAVWREESKKDGKIFYRTKTETIEVDEDGKKVTKVVPWVGIIQQAPRNFWGWFYEAFEKRGTLTDRDYSITRRGKAMETDYQPYPEDAQELDLSKFDEFKPDLEAMLTRQASKEYYDRFLHGITGDKEEVAQASSQLTEDDLSKLAEANEALASSAASGEYD